MRASLFFGTIALVIVTSAAKAETTATIAAAKDSDINASCRIPFESLNDPRTGKSFALSASLNENAKLAENLRQRYVVADLNSTDENGSCRGVQEYFTPVGELSEFPRLRGIAAARRPMSPPWRRKASRRSSRQKKGQATLQASRSSLKTCRIICNRSNGTRLTPWSNLPSSMDTAWDRR